jgi:hypothetical protein
MKHMAVQRSATCSNARLLMLWTLVTDTTGGDTELNLATKLHDVQFYLAHTCGCWCNAQYDTFEWLERPQVTRHVYEALRLLSHSVNTSRIISLRLAKNEKQTYWGISRVFRVRQQNDDFQLITQSTQRSGTLERSRQKNSFQMNDLISVRSSN